MTTVPRRPPPPTPKPGQVRVFRAMYTYTAQYGDELSFEEGDILYITEQTNKDWWKGRCQDKEGLIPTNYVEESAEAVDNPLHEAAKRGNIGFMKECIGNRVSVNGLDKAGAIPLHWASHGGHLQCVQMLLNDPKCEIDVKNKLGDTPLHAAAWKGHPEVVKVLLEKGARIDMQNNEGKTAFDLARDPNTASLLQHASRPIVAAEGYGDDDDSD